MPLMGLAPISPSQALSFELQWLGGIGPDDIGHVGVGQVDIGHVDTGYGIDISHGTDIVYAMG